MSCAPLLAGLRRLTRTAVAVAVLAALTAPTAPSAPTTLPGPAALTRPTAPTTLTALTGPTGVGAAVPDAAGVTTYRPPVTPLHVLRGFDPPATRYGAGHLGVDLAASGVVRTAGAGTVSFAGSVAGRGVVVVAHPDGIRTEYEPVRPAVARGQRVAAGDVLGTIDGLHRGCVASCLHWGARRGDAYLDPLSLLRPLGPVRLLPWSG